MNPGDPLQQLHDIVEAQAIGSWPLAVGWWLLILVSLALLCLLCGWLYRRHTRLYWKRQALKELEQLEARYFMTSPNLSDDAGNRQAAKLNSEVNIFLKRVLSSRNPDEDFRNQKPDEWRATLDTRIGVLSEREKDLLSHGQYMPQATRLERATFASLSSWLKELN